MWYANRIGESFAITGADEEGVWVRTGDDWNTSNVIRYHDLEQEEASKG